MPSNLRRILLSIILSVATIGWYTAIGSATEPEFEPIPSWVKPVPIQEQIKPPLAEISEGTYFLLNDYQVRVKDQTVAQYNHYAQKILNEKGTQASGQIQIAFDPSYQNLKIHQITVLRGETSIDLRNKAIIRLIQREKLLEYQLYDGSRTAYVILEDIRIGDIVEYSYTLYGTNPVFNGKYFDSFFVQWSVPVHSFFARLLWPEKRPLFIKNHNTDMLPAVGSNGEFKEYVWEQNNLSGLIPDSETPSFYNPYPWVQLSEFSDWKNVTKWARPLYHMPDPLSSELEKEIERIALRTSIPEQRVLAALDFVQNEIRYLGIEVGPGSHAPNKPSVTFQRRFGDCKDKSVLLTAMLTRLGIKACPALVNTRQKRMVSEWQSTPLAFDHVIVRVTLADRDYWVDPTRQGQKGNLETIFQPDYQIALVVSPDENGLVAMEPPDVVYAKEINEDFDLRKGVGTAADYQLETFFSGLSAELVRQNLMNKSRSELEKEFLNILARYYPSIEIRKPFEVTDIPGENTISIREFYSIPKVWGKTGNPAEDFEANFYPIAFFPYTELPEDSVRTMPLHIDKGIRIIQKTNVLLPEEWNIESSAEEVEDPAFLFQRDVSYSGRLLKLKYAYSTKTDFVAPADLEDYKKNLRLMDDQLGYGVYQRKSLEKNPGKYNSPILALGIGAALLSILGAIWIYRRSAVIPVDFPAAADPKLTGIGGWLILVAVGLCASPLKITIEFIQTLPSFSPSNWEVLTNSAYSSYHVLWKPTLLFELFSNIFLTVFSFLLLFLFFKKRRSFPDLFIVFMVLGLIIQFGDHVLASQIPAVKSEIDPQAIAELTRMFFFSIIWISYLKVSRRVKATFTFPENRHIDRSENSNPSTAGMFVLPDENL